MKGGIPNQMKTRSDVKAVDIIPMIDQLTKSNDTKLVNKALKHLKEVNTQQWVKQPELGESIIPFLLQQLMKDNKPSILENSTNLIFKMCSYAPYREMFVEQNVLLPLLEMLRLSPECKSLRKIALQTMTRIGENKSKQFPRLIQLLNSKRNYVRKAAKKMLSTTPILYHISSPNIDSFLNEIDGLMDEEISTEEEENQVGIKKPERRKARGYQKGLKRTMKKKSGDDTESAEEFDGSYNEKEREKKEEKQADEHQERKRKKKELKELKKMDKEKEKKEREKEREKDLNKSENEEKRNERK